MINAWGKCKENKYIHFVCNEVFPKIVLFCEVVWKKKWQIGAGHRWQYNIAHKYAIYVPYNNDKNTGMHLEY